MGIMTTTHSCHFIMSRHILTIRFVVLLKSWKVELIQAQNCKCGIYKKKELGVYVRRLLSN